MTTAGAACRPSTSIKAEKFRAAIKRGQVETWKAGFRRGGVPVTPDNKVYAAPCDGAAIFVRLRMVCGKPLVYFAVSFAATMRKNGRNQGFFNKPRYGAVALIIALAYRPTDWLLEPGSIRGSGS